MGRLGKGDRRGASAMQLQPAKAKIIHKNESQIGYDSCH